ncbi:hypothetical protein SS05631_c07960 [Sinorhizobium sp. CCBAU 05631]|nr:hypothetical protein SS05631_c07960 [Sinorhizobium sp. CCBAU 05631]
MAAASVGRAHFLAVSCNFDRASLGRGSQECGRIRPLPAIAAMTDVR